MLSRKRRGRRTLGLLVIAVVVVYWLVALSPEAARSERSATQVNERQMASIYVVAYGQFTGPPEWLEEAPNVHVLTQPAMCDYARLPYPCRVWGAYYNGDAYISDELDFSEVYAASILLHEYIHHFQWLREGKVNLADAAEERGDMAEACRLYKAHEWEAYRIQENVLIKAGDYVHARVVRFSAQLISCN